MHGITKVLLEVKTFYNEFQAVFTDPRIRQFEAVDESVLMQFVSGFAHDGGEDLSCLEACVRLYSEISGRVEHIKTRKNVTPTLLLGACTLSSL